MSADVIIIEIDINVLDRVTPKEKQILVNVFGFFQKSVQDTSADVDLLRRCCYKKKQQKIAQQ